MVHNPTCGCHNCFPINYPDRVNPHTQRTVYSGNSYRNCKPEHNHIKSNWSWHNNYTFQINCWWCGEPVFFHRNDNGGCVLFNSLGKLWPVHSCWEEHKNQQKSAILEIMNFRKQQLGTTTSKNCSFANNELESKVRIEGFIIGFESQQKILPNPESLSNPDSHLRYFVFESLDGDNIKILAPEYLKQEIEKYSFVSIDIETYNKKSLPIVCVVKIIEKAINSQETHTLEIKYDYESIMDLRWSYQSKKT